MARRMIRPAAHWTRWGIVDGHVALSGGELGKWPPPGAGASPSWVSSSPSWASASPSRTIGAFASLFQACSRPPLAGSKPVYAQWGTSRRLTQPAYSFGPSVPTAVLRFLRRIRPTARTRTLLIFTGPQNGVQGGWTGLSPGAGRFRVDAAEVAEQCLWCLKLWVHESLTFPPFHLSQLLPLLPGCRLAGPHGRPRDNVGRRSIVYCLLVDVDREPGVAMLSTC